MIFTPDHDRDVYAALNRFKTGLSFKTLFDNTKLFPEEKNLSVFLNRKITNGDIFKVTGMYYLADKHKTNTPSIDEEIKSLLKSSGITEESISETTYKSEPKVIKSDYFKKTNVPPLVTKPEIPSIASKREIGIEEKKPAPVNGKPVGNYNRTSVAGKYAYIFYRFRLSEPLSNDDLRRLINHDAFTDSSHYQAIHSLKKNGFIKQVEKGRYPTFVWTGNYAYPFRSMKMTDAEGMKYVPEEYFDLISKTHVKQAVEISPSTEEIKEVSKVVENIFPSFNVDETKAFLDNEIQELENKLFHFKQMRSLLELKAA